MARMGAGDCEDFAIAKYWLLSSLGVADEQLQMVVLQHTRRASCSTPFWWSTRPRASVSSTMSPTGSNLTRPMPNTSPMAKTLLS